MERRESLEEPIPNESLNDFTPFLAWITGNPIRGKEALAELAEEAEHGQAVAPVKIGKLLIGGQAGKLQHKDPGIIKKPPRKGRPMAQENVLMSNLKHQHTNQKNHIGNHGASDDLQKILKLNIPHHFHGMSQKGRLIKRKTSGYPEQKGVEDDHEQHKTEPGKSLEEIPGYKVTEVGKRFLVNIFQE